MEDRQLLVLYATETGNAFDVAVRLHREGTMRGLHVQVSSADTYTLGNLINETVVLFVVSTTGSGTEPRSMKPLWSLLARAELPDDLFDGLNYAVFGLGDSAYENFCWPAKKLDRRLEHLGGHKLLNRGEGDDQHPLGYEGSLDFWIKELFASLRHLYDGLSDVTYQPLSMTKPTVSFTFSSTTFTNEMISAFPDEHKIKMTVIKNRRTTPLDWFQDVRHIELETSESISYQPGDVAVIYPQNSEEDVNEFLLAIGWQDIADDPAELNIDISDLWRFHGIIPRRTTLRQLLRSYLDINSIPRRSFFENIYSFAHDEVEREKLQEYGVIEGQEELYDYCQRVRRTILEVLQDFHSISLPPNYLFDILPLLRPRQFSIASSALQHPRQIHLCVAIVSFRTKLRKPRKGVCTSYLASLFEGHQLAIEIQPGSFMLPKVATVPVICIGPGTGVAPMRAIIEHRVFEGAKETSLYFGCRSATKDQHYWKEWLHYEHDSVLSYHPAFSRDGIPGAKRVYVQDVMRRDLPRLGSLLFSQGAYVYISGSSNQMPRAVKATLGEAVGCVSGYNKSDSANYLKSMEQTGRLFEECWS